jgi:hypothetical protein
MRSQTICSAAVRAFSCASPQALGANFASTMTMTIVTASVLRHRDLEEGAGWIAIGQCRPAQRSVTNR